MKISLHKQDLSSRDNNDLVQAYVYTEMEVKSHMTLAKLELLLDIAEDQLESAKAHNDLALIQAKTEECEELAIEVSILRFG